ncbi:MAG: PDZ domain-containing protein [Planctomycetota bacterium]
MQYSAHPTCRAAPRLAAPLVRSVAAALVATTALVAPAPAQGWLGVMLDPGAARLTVAEVLPDSPAARAGLRPRDVVVAVDGHALADLDDLAVALASRDPGARVAVQIERAEKAMERRVVLGVVPIGGAAARAAVHRAVIRRRLGLQVVLRDGHPVIARMDPGGPAAGSGLRIGDEVVRCQGRVVTGLADLAGALQSAAAGEPQARPEVLLVVDRGALSLSVGVRMAPRPPVPPAPAPRRR